jgi:hypothetical protein
MTSKRRCANSTGCCKQYNIDDLAVFHEKLNFLVYYVFLRLKLWYILRNLPLHVSFTFYSCNSNSFDDYFCQFRLQRPLILILSHAGYPLPPNLNSTRSISSPHSRLAPRPAPRFAVPSLFYLFGWTPLNSDLRPYEQRLKFFQFLVLGQK